MDRRCLFILLNLILVSFSLGDLNLSNYPCYKPERLHPRNARVVGGYNAIKGESPYMAAVTRSGGNVFCGASIISEKVLILAAHCICNNQNKVIKPTQVRVYIGVNKVSDIKNLNDVNGNGPKEVIVEEIIKHPEYNCGVKSESDIAILQLKRSMEFDENIHALCLSIESSKISSMGLVSGYGMNNENIAIAEKPDILQLAKLPVWDNKDCKESYASFNKAFVISERQICAGGKNGVDSCFSDSGGPLIDMRSGALIGIVSNGVGCGRKGFPGIYTKVSKFTQWIQESANVP